MAILIVSGGYGNEQRRRLTEVGQSPWILTGRASGGCSVGYPFVWVPRFGTFYSLGDPTSGRFSRQWSVQACASCSRDDSMPFGSLVPKGGHGAARRAASVGGKFGMGSLMTVHVLIR